MVIQYKTDEQILNSDFEKFISTNKHRFRTEENTELVRKAFKFSMKAHENMKRQNGELYISHCLKVAKIVTENFGLGTTSAVAALLHDVPVKTEYTSEDINNRFGSKVFNIIEGLIKIKNAEYFENNTEASTLRQILISVSDDIRVIFIKLADKLDNVRTIDALPPGNRRKTINEILNIYAPIAHRIGLYNVKDEMEDICMRYNNPYIYQQIKERLQATERERLQFINRFILSLKAKLEKHNISCKITGRPKTVFSIYKKIQKKKVKFEEIYDLFAVRIIFTPENTETENYEALRIGSVITDLYPEKKERRRDWLKIPKETGYRALHITVMSSEGQWVEIQIRSKEMHEAAEHGLAAHWKYKGLKEKKSEFDEKVQDLLNYLAEDNSSALTFIDNLKINLFNPEIFVFTPKGEIKSLPNGATVLDFSFKIHTDIALKSIAGKVNGKTVSLDYVLKNGDQAEIITTKNQKPQRDWLSFVKTQRAVYHLKKIFREEIQKSIDNGKKIIEGILKENGAENIEKCEEDLIDEFHYKTKETFFEDIGENKIAVDKLKEKIKKICLKHKQIKFWNIKIPFTGSDKKNTSEKIKLTDTYTVADCCNPLPGDDITGVFDKKTGKILIHKSNCHTAIAEYAFGEKTFDAKWFSETKISVLKEFKLEGSPGTDTLTKITKKLMSDYNVSIQSLNYEVNGNKFICFLKLYLSEEKHTDTLIKNLKKLKITDKIEIIR